MRAVRAASVICGALHASRAAADAFGRGEGVPVELADASASASSRPWQPLSGHADQLPHLSPPANRCSAATPEHAATALKHFVYKRLGDNAATATPPSVLRCHVPAVEGEGQNWAVQRVGPFELQGGSDDMHIFNWGGVGQGWLDAVHDGGAGDDDAAARYITGTFIGVVRGDGTPLGNPPAHLHHIHLGWVRSDTDAHDRDAAGFRDARSKHPAFGEDVRFENGDWFEQRHGDSQCVASDGGIGCLGHAYPPGTGQRVRRAYDADAAARIPGVEPVNSEAYSSGLFIDGMVNDGRPKDQAAEPVTFWVEVAIRWTARKQQAIGLRNMGSPFCAQNGQVDGGDGSFASWMRAAAADPPATHYPGTLTDPALFYVPEREPSALWFDFAVGDSAGRFLWTTFHAHAHWFRSAHLIANAQMGDLGLCNAAKGKCEARRCADEGLRRGCSGPWASMLAPNIPTRLRFNDAAAAGAAGEEGGSSATARLTVAQFERQLARSIAERPGARKVCEFARALEWAANHTYDRRSTGGCDPAWALVPGQKVTVVAIYQPSADVRGEQHSGSKLGKADAESERNAMAFKIGKRGVPEHAIFRGLFQGSDAAADVLPGRGNWGLPSSNKCYATEEEESGKGLADSRNVGLEKLQRWCYSCTGGPCKSCKNCLKRGKDGVTSIKAGGCAPCWEGLACLHDTIIDCRMCWGLPPKPGEVIDNILTKQKLSRDDFKLNSKANAKCPCGGDRPCQHGAAGDNMCFAFADAGKEICPAGSHLCIS